MKVYTITGLVLIVSFEGFYPDPPGSITSDDFQQGVNLVL
jgi:hypothetical protein